MTNTLVFSEKKPPLDSFGQPVLIKKNSLFELLQLLNFYKQCWPYIVSIQKKKFGKKIKKAIPNNFVSLLIKSVLLRREHK